jgi:hypothetical protein
MKTRNMILSGTILGLLVVLLAINTVMADTPLMTTGYDNKVPEIYFLKKGFGFCQRVGGEQIPFTFGGSVPDGLDVQSSGCIEWVMGERSQSYAFTGEQIGELVVARDPNGAADLTNAYLAVDGDNRVKCVAIPKPAAEAIAAFWGYTDLAAELDDVPHLTVAGAGYIEAGYKPAYDKIYACLLTVTDGMNGDLTVRVYDESGEMAETPVEAWDFNPAVTLDITGDVSFPQAPAGNTVYSTEDLTIKNGGDKVAIAVWLGGTDLSGDAAARCPFSNVLDVEQNMKFRCTLNDGIWIDETWHQVMNKDWTATTGCSFPAGYDYTCFGLLPLFKAVPSTVNPVGRGNILFPQDKAECEFALQYPVPCIGTFTDGNLIVLMRAV